MDGTCGTANGLRSPTKPEAPRAPALSHDTRAKRTPESGQLRWRQTTRIHELPKRSASVVSNSVQSSPPAPPYTTTPTNPPSPDGGTPQPASMSAPPPAPTSPTFVDLIALLADKADPLVKLISTSVDRYQKGQDRQIKFQTHMAWVAVSVVFAIIGVAAWLTFVGKIDGSTFTFLLGLIVGYVLTFIRDQIKSPAS